MLNPALPLASREFPDPGVQCDVNTAPVPHIEHTSNYVKVALPLASREFPSGRWCSRDVHTVQVPYTEQTNNYGKSCSLIGQ